MKHCEYTTITWLNIKMAFFEEIQKDFVYMILLSGWIKSLIKYKKLPLIFNREMLTNVNVKQLYVVV